MYFYHYLYIVYSWKVFVLDQFLFFSLYSETSLTLYQASPGFYLSAVQVFWKHIWEKEKLLFVSNFSFSQSVFYPFGELSAIFIEFYIVVCKLFQFGRV